MNLVKGKPPIYEKIIQSGLKPQDNTVFAYGNDLYIQELKENEISSFLMVHEEVHMKQQGDNPEVWWDKYLTNTKFRFDQEVEAYRAEYRKICEMFKNKAQKWFKHELAKQLSSPMYGSLVTISQAENLIRKHG